MTTNVAKLSADLTANSSQFEASLNSADRKLLDSQRKWKSALAQTENSFNSLGGAVSKLTRSYGMLAGIVATVSGAGFVVLAKNALDTASALKDTSDRLQITTTQLQRYQYAAKLVGIQNETLETALTKLNARIAEGKLKYNSATDAMDSIAEAVKNAKTNTERAAIVNDAFGAKMGARFIPLLSQGADGLRQLGDEAERTGNVIDRNTIEQADKLSDQLDILFDTTKKNFTGGFLKAFTDQSGELKDIYADPEFAKGIEAAGNEIGGLTAKALEGASALGKFLIKYREIDEAGKNAFKSMDAAGARWLDNIDRKLGRGGLVDARNTKNAPAGPKEPFGPSTAGFNAKDIPRPGVKPPTPFVFSAQIEEQQRAAEKAQRDADQRKQTLAGVIDGLKQENDLLKIQTGMYGQKESVIDRAQRALKIQNQLTQAGITLTKQQQFAVNDYLDSIEQQTQLQKEQEAQQKRLEEQERNRQEAIDQLGATFESAFEDAIVSGKKLGDVLDSLLQDILRLVTRVTITAPLGNAITDYFKPENSGGGFLSKLFGGLPSFDVGTNSVPRDMIAQIHKGEEIVPAWAANQSRGGGDMNVQVIDRVGVKVQAQKTQTAQGTDLKLMISELVADEMRRPNTKVGQAMRETMSQSIIRR